MRKGDAMKLKQLKIILEKEVPDFTKPKDFLEQYRTPPEILLAMINYMMPYILSEKKEAVLVDLGSGTGMIAYGFSLAAMTYSIGIEIDEEAIQAAVKTKLWRQLPNIDFVQANALAPPLRKADYGAQNPPFGTRRAMIDRLFLLSLTKLRPKIIASVHSCNNKLVSILSKELTNRGYKVVTVECKKILIRQRMKHHTREAYYTRASILIAINKRSFK
ncbi:MAG: methyltransferase [Pyrodictiaceae archaeon]